MKKKNPEKYHINRVFMTGTTKIEYRVEESPDFQLITALQRFQDGNCLQVTLTSCSEGVERFSTEITEVTNREWINSQYHYNLQGEICDGNQLKVKKIQEKLKEKKQI